MKYRGTPVCSVITAPTENSVVSVEVLSALHVFSRVKDASTPPPSISESFDRHVVRTSDRVVVVEVSAEMTIYPRTVDFSVVEESVQSSLLAELEEEGVVPTPHAYAQGLKALTQRLVTRMRRYGVKVTQNVPIEE